MVQLPIFAPESDWTPPKISELPQWPERGDVAFDLETHDPQLRKFGPGVRRDGYITGFSFAWEGVKHYVPIRHEGGDNCDPDRALEYFRDQAKRFRGPGTRLVGANLPYDLDYSEESGIEWRPEGYTDVSSIAAPLLDENHFSYGLDAVARREGFEGKTEELLKRATKEFGLSDPKAQMYKLPARYVGQYGEDDSELPLRVLEVLEQQLQEENLWEIYQLECKLLPVLLKMRRRGVLIDLDQLDRVEAFSLRAEQDALDEMSRVSGHNITIADINRAAVVGKAIEETTGKRLPRTATGQISIAKVALDTLKGETVVQMFLRARKYNKLRNTFVEGIRGHAIDHGGGEYRIHCTFNQLKRSSDSADEGSQGTITGRLSCTMPNLQQQPARDPEIGPMWRAIYIPEHDCQWACLDYSQQEPRWVVHFAEIMNCMGAKAAGNAYRNDPTTDNHSMMSGLIYGPEFEAAAYAAGSDHPGYKRAKQIRDACKTIYLGLIYGMGGAKLCRSLGYPTERIEKNGRSIEIAGAEGRALLERFDKGAPFLRQLSDLAKGRAGRRGWIRTILGRVLRFPPHPSGMGYDWAHKALNKLIQGSSADQTKRAMVMMDEAGIPLQLQVHDEVDLSISSPEVAKTARTCMVNACPFDEDAQPGDGRCRIPAKVDVEVGPNWGEIAGVAW